jgi:hypothetical protein
MTQGLRDLSPHELSAELEQALLPFLVEHLRSRAPGHCMRISDLDRELAVRLCGRLQSEIAFANIAILANGHRHGIPDELVVTSTKLVELRNPLSDGTLRPPLLVFVPNEMHAAVEDSFGVATFEELHVGDVYQSVKNKLLHDMPGTVRSALMEIIRCLEDPANPWPFADQVSMVRFLLTAKINGADPEAIGGALYELGLVPDFELLTQPANVLHRTIRNRESVAKLTWSSKSERGRVLDLGLASRTFSKELGNFLADSGVEDPKAWTKQIVFNQQWWKLAFNRWAFEDGDHAPDTILISNVTTNLPIVEEDEEDNRLIQLVGQQIMPLGQGGIQKFGVTFQVEPHPQQVQGLSKFVAQIVSREQGPVGIVRSKAIWKSPTRQTTISFTKLTTIDWEEGWHFVRILPQTADGEPIPLAGELGESSPWSAPNSDATVVHSNESDLFYVLPGGEIDIEPSQRAVQREDSVAHALRRLQFTAFLDGREPDTIQLTDVHWTDRQPHGRATGTETLEVKFGREGSMHVPVSRPLKTVEQKILSSPEGPLSWRLPITLGVVGNSTSENTHWPKGPYAQDFLAARIKYFNALRSGTRELITQGADWHSLRPLVYEYASTYAICIQDLRRRIDIESGSRSQQAFADLRKLLAIDSIAMVISDHRGRRREATLIAPTHPLRALWFAVWAELGTAWLKAAQLAPREFVMSTRDALLRQLVPIGFPPVMPTESGHLLTAIDNLHPFWTLYASAGEKDPRGLVGDVCAALGLSEPAIGGALIDGAYLASRVRRYLFQHPYVRTLVINAFNAGRATVLADMLLQLQKDTTLADLRYDIRLFVPDPESAGVGEAITELLSPTASVTAQEADAFSTPTDNHLWPKLQVAIRSIHEFRSRSSANSAHLTLLFDVFPAEDVGATRATLRESAAPIHGLVQDFHTEYHEDESAISWRRQPRHGLALPIAEIEELTDLLASLSTTISQTTAAVATGQTGLDLRPVITLTLSAEDRALLHQVHEISDWVLTIDRNIGIEFFDHDRRSGRPDYLIDHSPDMTNSLGHRLVITSRSIAELEAMLCPVLETYHLQAEGRHAIAILDQLRSLSGRLALKLISAPTQRAEALGLALSRLYLEHQGVFENQIVVPLDAHLELYQALKRQADEIGDEVSFKRTDLALFDLDVSNRLLTCRLVEVKCYSDVGNMGAFNQLKSDIANQIQRSEEVLAYHFDPHRTPIDRPDRLVKTRELITLLEFYLNRAERYGIVNSDAVEEARFFLRTLEDGYRLSFTRSGIIFDFEKTGTELPELEEGIEFHRIGKDLIQQLVDSATPDTESFVSETSKAEREIREEEVMAYGIEEIRRRRERAPSVPTLDTAAFLSRPRDRSVSWEELRTRQTLGADGQDSDDIATMPDVAPEGHSNAESHAISQTDSLHLETSGPPSSKSEYSHPIEDANLPDNSGQNIHEAARTLIATPSYDILLGVTDSSPQYGLLGEVAGRKVAIDLNQTHTISLFGVQGGGKSYTLGTIAEMASLPIENINALPQPLATVIFHYSPTMDYKPEFTSMISPNSDIAQLKALKDTYGANPRALSDVVLLVPGDKLDERRFEYPALTIYPLKFAATELQTSHWRFLMGAVGNQATYIRQLNRLMRSLRDNLTLESIKQGINKSNLSDQLKDLARIRLALAAEYVDDSASVKSLIRPGRLIIVDLRDEFIEKDEALGLFVVLLQLFADAKYEGSHFNKLVVFDEAHKYIENPDLVAGLVEAVREMRHKGTSILVASQDPPSVPVSLIELSTQIILHKFNSPAWLRHIQKANTALGGLTAEKMSHLRPGEAFIWSSRATDDAFMKGTVKVNCRPRATAHGGNTKTAV